MKTAKLYLNKSGADEEIDKNITTTTPLSWGYFVREPLIEIKTDYRSFVFRLFKYQKT